MEEIWNNVCRYYKVPDNVASSWFTRIQQRLSQDSVPRHYHNWQELLVSKQEILRNCKPSVVLAAFFQYYSFDGRLTCVAENCEAFNEFCRDANFRDTDARDLILKLLGDKNSFTVCCYDEEASQLQDMDLMILGSSPDEYKRYTQLLRLEYQCMNDFDYKQMRLKVLQTLLMIPNIFACAEYQAKYEQQARTNIKQEIELLKH